MYAANGKEEIKKLNAEISDAGATVRFEGNKMIVTYNLEKMSLNDEEKQTVIAEVQEIRAEFKNNKDFKKIAKWLINATGVKTAKLVVELKNNGSNLFAVTI